MRVYNEDGFPPLSGMPPLPRERLGEGRGGAPGVIGEAVDGGPRDR